MQTLLPVQCTLHNTLYIRLTTKSHVKPIDRCQRLVSIFCLPKHASVSITFWKNKIKTCKHEHVSRAMAIGLRTVLRKLWYVYRCRVRKQMTAGTQADDCRYGVS